MPRKTSEVCPVTGSPRTLTLQSSHGHWVRRSTGDGRTQGLLSAPVAAATALAGLRALQAEAFLTGESYHILVGGGQVVQVTMYQRLRVPTVHRSTDWRWWMPLSHLGARGIMRALQEVSLLAFVSSHLTKRPATERDLAVVDVKMRWAENGMAGWQG